jgi:orotate phosphoribosyltransferase
MDAKEEVLHLFEKTGALLKGHFVLRSGLHSGHFFQCAQVCQDMAAVTRMAELTLDKVAEFEYETVVAPAMGGLVIGQEIARQAAKRYIFLEKQDGDLALRRGFKIRKGEKVLITEDVVTRGGRVEEALKIVRDQGGIPVAVTVIVDRSGGAPDFGTPFMSLAELSFPTYQADQLPLELADIPITKPGS